MPQTNNVLGQDIRRQEFLKNVQKPDTDCIEIVLTGNTLTPNLMFEHTMMYYTSPVNTSTNVIFKNPLKKEDRSLHTIFINNLSNSLGKSFIFESDYQFMPEEDLTNTIFVDAGKILVLYGMIINGIMYLRKSLETTI